MLILNTSPQQSKSRCPGHAGWLALALVLAVLAAFLVEVTR